MKPAWLLVACVATLVAVVACEDRADAKPPGLRWGERIARAHTSTVWRVQDGSFTCYVVTNDTVASASPAISCMRGEP